MARRVGAWLAAGLLGSGAVVGCGATSSQPTSGAHSTAYRAQAQAACEAFYNQTYALKPPVGLAAVEKLAASQARIRTQELTRLSALHPTGTVGTNYAAYVTNLGQLYGLMTATADPAAAQARVTELRSVTNDQAQALGLPACTRNPYTATRTYSSSTTAAP